ncbi:hypothetical protein BMBphi_gp044 [Bacillus phage vB_BthS_BMBphi]|nr:hypothetical protein BMBphi_gp044 [Bacillus phage vB_BthS_BMBphi]
MGTQRQIDMTFDISYPSDQSKFLQRLGEKNPTDIVVQVFNKGVPYNLSGTTLGFEMRNDKEKILIDKDQSRFTLVLPLEGVFSYRPPLQVQSFYGNSYLAYFTFESGANRITTERFRFYNDEDVQLAVAPELQEHYVSVIDDLVASNKSAMDEAKAIRDLINANGVVKKVGDTMTGNLKIERGKGERAFEIYSEGNPSAKLADDENNIFMYDGKSNKVIWQYRKNIGDFILNTSSNLLKNTGDAMAGDLIIDRPNATTHRNLAYSTAGVRDVTLGQNTSGKWLAWDQVGGNGIYEYDKASKTFNVLAPNTNLMKKTDYSGKDGQVNLTLTADASAVDTTSPSIAIRRGNTVTVRCNLFRKVGSSSNLMSVLPSEMRPISTVFVNALAHDGTVCRVTIGVDGNLFIGANGNTSTEGKQLAENITYVVN